MVTAERQGRLPRERETTSCVCRVRRIVGKVQVGYVYVDGLDEGAREREDHFMRLLGSERGQS